jgi:hypothetical protein
VPADQRPDYHKWVRFYFDFCDKYGHSPAAPTSLGPFLTKLTSKNQSVGRRSQASAAVRLLIQAAPEPVGTPPPLPATPASSPRSILNRQPSGLGQALRARSSPLPPPAARAAQPPPPPPTAQRPSPQPPRATRQDRPIAPVSPIGWRPESSSGFGLHCAWAPGLLAAGVPRPGGGDPPPELLDQDPGSLKSKVQSRGATRHSNSRLQQLRRSRWDPDGKFNIGSHPAPDRAEGRAGASPEPPRSTLDLDRGYYGEAPVGLWRNDRAVEDATPPIPPKTAKNRNPLCKCYNHR